MRGQRSRMGSFMDDCPQLSGQPRADNLGRTTSGGQPRADNLGHSTKEPHQISHKGPKWETLLQIRLACKSMLFPTGNSASLRSPAMRDRALME
jgi:hypothetical protein